MTDTTAKIRSKGLDATGVTEEIANEMHAHKGRHYMAIVEMKVDETHDKADGKHKVDLVLTQVEPAVDPALSDHLRELTRTLYQNRALTSDDQQLKIEGSDDLEPTVPQVIAAGQQFAATQDDPLPDPDDEDAAAAIDAAYADGDDEPANPDDATYEPHPFVHGTDGEAIDGDHCVECKQHKSSAIHSDDVAEAAATPVLNHADPFSTV